jgi:hypothetical protein
MGINLFGLQLGPALVVKKFECNSEQGTVEIKGRAPGLVAFILSAMGLDATTTFSADRQMITCKKTSLSGEDHVTVPTPCVATLACGYNKPIGLLFLAVVFFLQGLYMSFEGGRHGGKMGMVSILVGIGCAVAYFLLKKMYLYVITNGGNIIGLKFKRSVIENVQVDITKVKEAIEVLRNNVLRSHNSSAISISPPTAGDL